VVEQAVCVGMGGWKSSVYCGGMGEKATRHWERKAICGICSALAHAVCATGFDICGLAMLAAAMCTQRLTCCGRFHHMMWDEEPWTPACSDMTHAPAALRQ